MSYCQKCGAETVSSTNAITLCANCQLNKIQTLTTQNNRLIILHYYDTRRY